MMDSKMKGLVRKAKSRVGQAADAAYGIAKKTGIAPKTTVRIKRAKRMPVIAEDGSVIKNPKKYYGK